LEHVASSQAEQIEKLEDRVESLRDWTGGTNGTAVTSLVAVITRQRYYAPEDQSGFGYPWLQAARS
jgi:hypothetical protein